jgi:hypothetical protein
MPDAKTRTARAGHVVGLCSGACHERARPAPHRPQSPRFRAHRDGAYRGPRPRRPGGRGDPRRTRLGRPNAQSEGVRHRLFPVLQPQQAERCNRPEGPARTGGREAPDRHGGRPDRELRPRHDGAAGPWLRPDRRGLPPPRLPVAQGFPSRPLRKPRGTGRGRADDVRPRLHDRSAGTAAARRGQHHRRDGRRDGGGRSAGGARGTGADRQGPVRDLRAF